MESASAVMLAIGHCWSICYGESSRVATTLKKAFLLVSDEGQMGLAQHFIISVCRQTPDENTLAKSFNC